MVTWLISGGSGFGDDLLTGQGRGMIDETFFQVEVMPTFKGGDLTKFRDWVGKRQTTLRLLLTIK